MLKREKSPITLGKNQWKLYQKKMGLITEEEKKITIGGVPYDIDPQIDDLSDVAEQIAANSGLNKEDIIREIKAQLKGEENIIDEYPIAKTSKQSQIDKMIKSIHTQSQPIIALKREIFDFNNTLSGSGTDQTSKTELPFSRADSKKAMFSKSHENTGIFQKALWLTTVDDQTKKAEYEKLKNYYESKIGQSMGSKTSIGSENNVKRYMVGYSADQLKNIAKNLMTLNPLVKYVYNEPTGIDFVIEELLQIAKRLGLRGTLDPQGKKQRGSGVGAPNRQEREAIGQQYVEQFKDLRDRSLAYIKDVEHKQEILNKLQKDMKDINDDNELIVFVPIEIAGEDEKGSVIDFNIPPKIKKVNKKVQKLNETENKDESGLRVNLVNIQREKSEKTKTIEKWRFYQEKIRNKIIKEEDIIDNNLGFITGV